jgi:hypothetical protein
VCVEGEGEGGGTTAPRKSYESRCNRLKRQKAMGTVHKVGLSMTFTKGIDAGFSCESFIELLIKSSGGFTTIIQSLSAPGGCGSQESFTQHPRRHL